MKEIQKRTLILPVSLHLREAGEGEAESRVLDGYALKFGVRSVLIGYYFEEGDTLPIIYNYQETSELRMFIKDQKLESVWTPKTTGTMYPLNQIPADRKRLPGFAWYDYVRHVNRYDIFNWRDKNGKKGSNHL